MFALAIASLATSACADLARSNEITIKAEPAVVPAAANRAAPQPNAAVAAAAAAPAAPAPAGGG